MKCEERSSPSCYLPVRFQSYSDARGTSRQAFLSHLILYQISVRLNPPLSSFCLTISPSVMVPEDLSEESLRKKLIGSKILEEGDDERALAALSKGRSGPMDMAIVWK